MKTLLEEVVLSNGIPKDCICVSREFVRHPQGFAVGALVMNVHTKKYFIYTGRRLATVPQDYARELSYIKF